MVGSPMRFLILLLLSSAAFAETRTWTDSTGKFTVKAELVDVNDGIAALRVGDAIKRVPLPRLSEADREYATSADAVKVWVGNVVGVNDGNSLVLRTDVISTVDLAGVDGSEGDEPYAKAATRALTDKALGHTVRVEWSRRTPDGTILGQVKYRDLWINKEMLDDGWGRYDKLGAESAILATSETKARDAKIGIWADSDSDDWLGFRNPPATSRGPPVSSLAPQGQSSERRADDPIVDVTKSGTKYHTAGCRYLSKSSISMPLSEASRRYSPCSVCHPPLLGDTHSDNSVTKFSQSTSTPSNRSLPAYTFPKSVDRNPHGESVTGHTATGIPTFTGPRGGHYHYSKSGKKVYEARNRVDSMFNRMLKSAAFLFVVLLGRSAIAEIEIVLQNGFIEAYKNRATIDVNFVVDKAHARPNAPSKDGDLHIAGRAEEVKLPMVAEIMNAKDETEAVDQIHELEGTSSTVPLTGFWRIWCEHGGSSRQVQGESLEPFQTTNPDHVFEIHPVTNLNHQSLLGTLREIEGFDTKDAEQSFTKYEDITCEIVPKTNSTVIRTRMAGFNYVEFTMRLSPEGAKEVDDGRFAFAEVCDLEGELLVRKRRMVFVKDSEPEIKTRNLPEGTLVHVLGIPRINLALVDWRLQGS